MLGACTSGALGANVTGNSSIFDDRININTNYGHAHAVGEKWDLYQYLFLKSGMLFYYQFSHNSGKDGSYAGADTSSLGFNAGILYPGNRYTPIASHTSSKSNAYSSGRRPPSAFANSQAQQYGRYGVKGNAAAGYSGGVGQAYSKSQSQQIAIPLGIGGGVLLSNLPEPEPPKEPTIDEDKKKTSPKSGEANPSAPSDRFIF